MAMGERPPLALISPAASARMATAESLMNIAAADLLDGLERIRISANWMAAVNVDGAALYEAVEAVKDLCIDLRISIPVGKDSTSMKMNWKDEASSEAREVTAPISLVVSAFTTVRNIHNTWTPTLRKIEEAGIGETVLLLVDLAEGHKAIGGSALAQTFKQIGNECPDVRNNQLLKDYFDAIDQLHESGCVLAYHDVSDGGLLTTLAEMMFAGRCGLHIMLDYLCVSNSSADIMPTLFNEELSAVFQVRKGDERKFRGCFATCGPPDGLIKRIGRVAPQGQHDLVIYHKANLVYRKPLTDMQKLWAATSHQMQRLRDNPSCADQEYAAMADLTDPGLSYNLTFNPAQNILPFATKISSRFMQKPRVAILREQGTNGQAEMAFAFSTAGFSAFDVHMTDLISGRVSLASFTGLAACGGFSHGDVLGSGRGWACSILQNTGLRNEFKTFFERRDTFTLGVCNGCQFLSHLKGLIPGTEAWPTFETNKSEVYEARVSTSSTSLSLAYTGSLVWPSMVVSDADPANRSNTMAVVDAPYFTMVRITNPHNRSIFLHSMHNSSFPISSAHGEGRASFPSSSSLDQLRSNNQLSLQYVDNKTLNPTESYPANPNGSPQGICGISSMDGRVLALMPHPERTVLRGTGSWVKDVKAKESGDVGPWGRLFLNARRWVG
ncbi:MAG: hypothetical protein Q9180_006081 [Flavoplaca navasiana]